MNWLSGIFPERSQCIYMENWGCEGCVDKLNHVCTVIEHQVYTGSTKVCIDMFALPPHFRRSFQRSGMLDCMKKSGHICMIFTTAKGDNLWEEQMCQKFVSAGIGCRILTIIQLKAHNGHCTEFWKYMVSQIVEKCTHTDLYYIFKEIVKSEDAHVWYEEWGGSKLNAVVYQDARNQYKASKFVNILESFVEWFRVAWWDTSDLHSDLQGGNVVFNKHHFSIIDHGYLNAEYLRKKIQDTIHDEVNDAVVMLVMWTEELRKTSDIRKIAFIFNKFFQYSPELVMFMSLLKDSSPARRNTQHMYIHVYTEVGVPLQFYNDCLQVFYATRPPAVPGNNKNFENVVLHTREYVKFFQTWYKNTNFMYYIDKYQLSNTIICLIHHWHCRNRLYLM